VETDGAHLAFKVSKHTATSGKPMDKDYARALRGGVLLAASRLTGGTPTRHGFNVGKMKIQVIAYATAGTRRGSMDVEQRKWSSTPPTLGNCYLHCGFGKSEKNGDPGFPNSWQGGVRA
jgi:hypothetical protein